MVLNLTILLAVGLWGGGGGDTNTTIEVQSWEEGRRNSNQMEHYRILEFLKYEEKIQQIE